MDSLSPTPSLSQLDSFFTKGEDFDQSAHSPPEIDLSNGLGGIKGNEFWTIMELNPLGISLLERLWDFLGGRLSPTLKELEEVELHLVNGDGGNEWLLLNTPESLSSMETSWSGCADRESRNGEGLNGGNESKEKKELGCDIDREWVADPGLKLSEAGCRVVGIWENGEVGGIKLGCDGGTPIRLALSLKGLENRGADERMKLGFKSSWEMGFLGMEEDEVPKDEWSLWIISLLLHFSVSPIFRSKFDG